MGGAGVDPPPRKSNTFFLRSLTLSVPIYRHFQSNGDNWRSIKHRKNFFNIIEHYIIFFCSTFDTSSDGRFFSQLNNNAKLK